MQKRKNSSHQVHKTSLARKQNLYLDERLLALENEIQGLTKSTKVINDAHQKNVSEEVKQEHHLLELEEGSYDELTWKNIKKQISQKRNLLLRFFSFFSLAFFILPLLHNFFLPKNTFQVEYNIFSFSIYCILVVVLLLVFNRKFVLSYSYEQSKLHTISYTMMALCSFLLYYVITILVEVDVTYFILLSQLFYVLGSLFIAFAIIGFKFFKQTYKHWLFFIFLVNVYYLFTQFLWYYWSFSSGLVAKITHGVLWLFNKTAFIDLSFNDPIIGVENFSVTIGQPCSGIESLSVFIALFLMLVVYEHKNLGKRRTFLVFVIGMLGVFCMNILRTALIVLLGTRYPDFATGAFHSNVGWFLFIVFIFVFLQIFYNWMVKYKE